MSTLKLNQWLNPDGTENYKVRAWATINGTGVIAVRASGGISSVIDNGVGDYTFNYAFTLPDANAAVSALSDNAGAAAFRPYLRTSNGLPTATSVRVGTVDSANTPADATYLHVTVTR